MQSESRGSVLVVDDEPTIAEVVTRYLQRAGYQTAIAADGAEALACAAERRPDLIVLDLMLPRFSGLEVMRRLREQERNPIPIILLTAKGEESDRIDAVLRRVDLPRDQQPAIDLGELVIDPAARRVLVRGEEVALTSREFELLLFLVRHPGQVFSRTQLMDAIWQYTFYSDTSTVTVHVRRLRSKIELDPTEPRHLQTVWGVGYRFQP